MLVLACTVHAAPAQHPTIPLYQNTIPNARVTPAWYREKDSLGRIFQVSVPSLIPYFPEKENTNGTAILIFPGGGYRLLSMPTAEEMAKAFAENGITAFIVKYRLPHDSIMKDKSTGPLQDAQAAIRLVRSRAKEWNLDPRKVGAMGLSAGGHLVSSAGTQIGKMLINNTELPDDHPDFMALLYPVIIYDPEVPRTRENLIGPSPTQAQLDAYSTDRQVGPHTAPAFLVHAADDDVIPVKNSLIFFNALLANKVKSEMHILQNGGHGFGITDHHAKDNWFIAFKSWMTENGFLKQD